MTEQTAETPAPETAPEPAPEPAPAPEHEAAAAEVADETRTVEWHGLSISLGSKMPMSVAFDLAEADGREDPLVVLRLLASILGPDRIAQVKNILNAENVSLDEEGYEVLGELTQAVFGAYGLGTGESSASDDS